VPRPVALIGIVLIAAAVGWGVLRHITAKTTSDSSIRQEEVAGRSPLPINKSEPTASAGPSIPASSPFPSRSVDAVVGGPRTAPQQTVYSNSRVAGRPGYYAPDDPESLSVMTGRRDAPAVDLELDGGASSMEELGRALVAALVAKDQNALDGLRVTKHEFRVICWPEFPESRPVTNITLDDAWMMAAAKNHAASSRALGNYGGRDLELVDMERPAPFAYRNFQRYSGVVLVARDRQSREVLPLTFAGTVIERHGRYKVLMYRDR
jgi:hypothetical protein